MNDLYIKFETKIYEKTSVLINFSKTQILFGIIKYNCDIENVLILIFKYYIYRQRCRNENLYLPALKNDIYCTIIIKSINIWPISMENKLILRRND